MGPAGRVATLSFSRTTWPVSVALLFQSLGFFVWQMVLLIVMEIKWNDMSDLGAHEISRVTHS